MGSQGTEGRVESKEGTGFDFGQEKKRKEQKTVSQHLCECPRPKRGK